MKFSNDKFPNLRHNFDNKCPIVERNARLDKLPCGISTLGIFIRLLCYPAGLLNFLKYAYGFSFLFFSFSLLQDDSHSNWTWEDILWRGKILEARWPFLVRC